MEKTRLTFTQDDYEVEATVKQLNPLNQSLWFKQFLLLSEEKRRKIKDKVLSSLKEYKPNTYKFILKFKCELVGLCPKIEYALLNSNEGEINCTWIHHFSGPTMLFWCDEGEFGFFVNPNLSYNDSILNKIEGNKQDSLIRGFTG